MKKIIGILIGVVLSAGAYAQFTQGSFMLGGSVTGDFNTNKSKSGGTTTTQGHTNSISLSPQVGYFIMDNFALGAGLNLNSSTFKDENDNKVTSSSTSLAPFGRYYFDKLYAQLGGDFGSGKTKFTSGSNSSETKFALSGWNLALGYAFLLNDHVALEPQLGYGASYQKNKTSDVTDIDTGLFFRLGFQVYLPK